MAATVYFSLNLSCDVVADAVAFSLVLSYDVVTVAIVCEGVWLFSCIRLLLSLFVAAVNVCYCCLESQFVLLPRCAISVCAKRNIF